jgi:hypothetical protein
VTTTRPAPGVRAGLGEALRHAQRDLGAGAVRRLRPVVARPGHGHVGVGAGRAQRDLVQPLGAARGAAEGGQVLRIQAVQGQVALLRRLHHLQRGGGIGAPSRDELRVQRRPGEGGQQRRQRDGDQQFDEREAAPRWRHGGQSSASRRRRFCVWSM